MLSAALGAAAAFAEITFDAGADLRVRQEFYDNVMGLPGGGLQSTSPYGKYVNRMRFRPRVWGEVRFGDKLRVYSRLADEFRWNVQPNTRSSAFPDELFLDNLFVEGKGLFDGLLDFTVGRQDILNLYGLGRVFQDGTPGDGSRSLFSDMARFTLNFEDDSKFDFFALYDHDDNHLRWGSGRSDHRSLTGLGASDAESERDDIAAIATPQCAEFYGLDALENDMQSNALNFTRFICICATPTVYKNADKISLMFTVPNRPGTLFGVISRLASAGINMTKIESRPIPGTDFEFMFYVDIDGSLADGRLVGVLRTLSSTLEQLKVLGGYSEVSLK